MSKLNKRLKAQMDSFRANDIIIEAVTNADGTGLPDDLEGDVVDADSIPDSLLARIEAKIDLAIEDMDDDDDFDEDDAFLDDDEDGIDLTDDELDELDDFDEEDDEDDL